MSQYGEQFCTDEEAADLFEKYRTEDPFPNIAPALLNSADIDDYVKATGMICPYYSPRLLKSASYEAQIGDKAVYWDGTGEKYEVDLSDGKSVTIEPNSLIFLTTKQKFRLPDYIAVRFNLRITNVHRGLLLGTGPLVDPGFEGHLMIPLHNFTTNPYKFCGGERFMWIEFTKISNHPRWTKNENDVEPRRGEYKAFRPKPDSGFDHYLFEASPHSPIRSAIPAVEEKAEEAKRTVATIKNWGIVSIVAAILATAFALVPIFNDFSDLAVDTTDLITDTRAEIERSERLAEIILWRVIAIEERQLESIQSVRGELTRQNQELRDEIDAIQQQIKEDGISAPVDPEQN